MQSDYFQYLSRHVQEKIMAGGIFQRIDAGGIKKLRAHAVIIG
jgi:hypothetical protein